VSQPVKTGAELIEQIERTISPTPVLWWLGRHGFILRFAHITFYIDPHLSDDGAPLHPATIRHADLVLVTQADALDAPAVAQILEHSPSAKLVLPKSAADAAQRAGIPFNRMTTTDADLRIEYFKDNLYGRVYAIPSARPELDWTPIRGYPYLGYLIRFGRWTVYHAGPSAPYEGLADRLRPFNVSVVLVPIGDDYFSIPAAADLACSVGASWIVPVAAERRHENAFLNHMLGHRPEQQFKIFERAEKWTVPEE